MDSAPPFGAQLRQIRIAADRTQEQLAEDVGCSAETIRSFENGRRRPSREMAARMAAILGLGGAAREAFVASARAAPPRPRRAEGAGRGGAQRAEPDGGQSDGSPLLDTKLYLPRPRADLVQRPRLLRLLERGRLRPLTLVAAPAGFGKTTLLASWLAERARAGGGRQAAWLALDAGDSDPSLFVRYLAAALQTIEPRFGLAALRLLRGAQRPQVGALLTLLARDLALLPEGSTLVLDDYHLVEGPEVHQALAFLIEQLPPQLHLVIASRVDPPLPLGRLRARGVLTELRAADLRFTEAEAAAFFREVMEVPLAPEDVAALEGRTEGWVAGLQLAGLAMQHGGDPGAFVRAFAGSNRFVVDYLAEEVLERLPGHLHSFVLQTSVLGRLCGPLCDALLGLGEGGGPDAPQAAYSQLLLNELERANVFLIPLDDERRWYRYHHLFGEVVRGRLLQGAPPQQVAELHRRASRWYEAAGLEAEAVEHALAAADWGRAAGLLVHVIPRVVMGRGQFQTGLRWLGALPAEVLRASPTLGVYYAGVLMYSNQVEAAAERLREAEAALAAGAPEGRGDAEARLIRGQAAVIGGAICRIRGDLAGCAARSQEALALLPDPDTAPLKLRPLAALNASRAFLVTGDVSPAVEERAAAAVAPLRASGNSFALLTSQINLARLYAAQGRLRQAAATYAEARATAAPLGDLAATVGGAAYYLGLGEIHRQWDELAEAEGLLRAGLALAEDGPTVDADVLTLGYLAQARLLAGRGDLAAAQRALARFREIAAERAVAPELLARAAAEGARLALAAGDLGRAAAWADGCGLDPGGPLPYLREDELLTLARVRAARCAAGGAAELGPERSMLDRMLAAAEAGGRGHSAIQILVVRAALRRAAGDPGALEDLGRALALGAPEGYARVFVDEGPPVLELLREAQRAGLAPGYAGRLLAIGGWAPGGDGRSG